MARDAVWALLADDVVLRDELDVVEVFPNYGVRTPPNRGNFLLLRWEEVTARGGVTAQGYVQVLTVWAHRKRHESADFVPLSRILARVRGVLTGAAQFTGEDGVPFRAARFTGEGRDLFDEGFDTLTRNATFEIACGMNGEQ